MEKSDKLKRFYSEKHHYKDGINRLRDLALRCGLYETYKWNFPTYTLDNKNIMAICKFKGHFGIWFFNGVFLSDPNKLLENAQEGKTKAMRHWKFTSLDEINESLVKTYISEAIENHKKGLHFKPIKNTDSRLSIPQHLSSVFETDRELEIAFQKLTPAKQREYCEYIESAKQEKTKLSRIDKITLMILEGKGLNDNYRK